MKAYKRSQGTLMALNRMTAVSHLSSPPCPFGINAEIYPSGNLRNVLPLTCRELVKLEKFPFIRVENALVISSQTMPLVFCLFSVL